MHGMKTNDEIRERLKVIAHTAFNSVNDMAIKTGVEQRSLDKFLKGDSVGLNTKTFMKILEYLGGQIVLPGDIPPSVGNNIGDYTLVPKAKAKLGPRSNILTDGESVGFYAFKNDFLLAIGLNSIDDLRLFDVLGTSMVPTIQDRDTVLIALKDKDIISGQIYAIRVEDEIQVKRIIRTPGQIIIRSDNRDFEDYVVNATDEAHLDAFGIIGRVRWQGRIY
jgi:hypothetical protein